MERRESLKRGIVLCMDLLGLLLQTAIYALFWFYVYYPLLTQPRVSVDGYALGNGLKLYFRGHFLVLAIYFVLLLFFSNTYGGLKIGYLKQGDVFFSQIFALLCVNVLSYFQISLMRNWLVPVRPMLEVFGLQLAVFFFWSLFANAVCRRVLPPRKLLLISGAYPTDDILRKFGSRRDRYEVVRCVNISEGVDAVLRECRNTYDGVILWDLPTAYRNTLLKDCYGRSQRVYLMPKIPDVLVKGADELHLFDTPIFLVREYSLRLEQRLLKRTIDIVFACILIIVASPIMLLTALLIKCYDRGPVLYRQTRCTKERREFQILKFRSMRVDAEKDGVARLAARNDERITPIGRVIRPCRIDELPQLFNILKGEMSFIGPRPERPEMIARYIEDMPEFAFRMKVRAGLAGYAQVYGKYNTTPYDKLKLDLTYIENYSVWLDLKLMLLTLKILFTPDSTEGVEDTPPLPPGEDDPRSVRQKDAP